MGSDRARNSYDASRGYRAIVSQQGRVTIEADANENEEIRAAESRAELIDIVAPSGSPDDGFKISVLTPVPADLDFEFDAGTMYVGGVRVPTAGATYDGQQQLEWLDFPAGSLAAIPTGTGAFNEEVYLELEEHEVGSVEDPTLLEEALGGPDTAARTRIIPRVKRATVTGSTCSEAFGGVLEQLADLGLTFDPATMRLAGTMTLRADFNRSAAAPDPCDPIAHDGYLGAENQLIRVQVVDATTFLWGYDNASFLYRVTVDSTGTKLRLAAPPVDVFHQPRAGQWVEVLRPAVQLDASAKVAAHTGAAAALASAYDPATRTVTLATALTNVPTDPATGQPIEMFMRVWESQQTFGANATTGVALQTAEGVANGVIIFTSTGKRIAGDYWMIGVRPTTPQQVYPARLATMQPPDGPKRWIVPLAVIAWADGRASATVADCRHTFKNLVELTEDDSGCCELLLRPGDNLQALIDARIAQNAAKKMFGLDIRFASGMFELDETLWIDAAPQRGAISVSGCGRSTVLRANGREAALALRGWDSARVSDLTVFGTVARPGHGAKNREENFPPLQGDELRHLTGAVTLLDCATGSVERLIAFCAAGPTRGASCIAVRCTEQPCDVRVRDNELWIGHHQVGVLIIDAGRVTVEDNKLGLNPFAPRPDRLEPSVVKYELRGAVIEALGENVVEGMERRDLEKLLKASYRQLLDKEVGGPLRAEKATALRRKVGAIRKKLVSAAGQGIVVAGSRAADVRINNNTISGAMDGIHVGFSQRSAMDVIADVAPPLRVERLQIVGNTIALQIPRRSGGAHCGIFVGNAYVTTIRDNQVTNGDLDDDVYRRGEGIRVWGQLGPVMLILGNTCIETDLGFRVVAVPGGWDNDKRQWRLSKNFTFNTTAVDLASGVSLDPDNVFA